MHDLTAEEVIERWDTLAEQYAAHCSKYGDINKEVLLTPLILEMLGDVKGKRILDAGCGEGFLSRLMAERGASVTAIDYSTKLLEFARERTADDLQIDYLHANLECLDVLDDNTFDVVVSCVVILDVPDYQAAIKEMYRVLCPGGTCILAMTHPCFSSDGGWVRDPDGVKLHWKTDNYFHERAVEVPWPPGADSKPIYFHRTLTNYYRAITSTGFTVRDLVEPYPSQEAIEVHPHFVNDLRMSHFLVFQLAKRTALHQDILDRLEAARRGLIQTVQPFTLRELNHRPRGTASGIRQLLNHLWATEAWMMERVARALRREPDLSREEAEEQLPDVLGVLIKGLLIHAKGLGVVDPSEPVQPILARFDAVRERTRETLSALGPDDLHKELIDPCEDDKTVRDVLNHMHGHELLHIGAMLNIRGILENNGG